MKKIFCAKIKLSCSSILNSRFSHVLEIGKSKLSIFNDFNKGKCIKEKDVKTKGDKILNILSFIYDINYTYSLKVIKENNYIEEMFNNLGKPENLKPYFEIINRVINQKIEKED